MVFRIFAFAVSIPKLTASHPASFILLSTSLDTVSTLANEDHLILRPLASISLQISVQCFLFAVKRSSAIFICGKPRVERYSSSSTTDFVFLYLTFAPTIFLPTQKMHLNGHPLLVVILMGMLSALYLPRGRRCLAGTGRALTSACFFLGPVRCTPDESRYKIPSTFSHFRPFSIALVSSSTDSSPSPLTMMSISGKSFIVSSAQKETWGPPITVTIFGSIFLISFTISAAVLNVMVTEVIPANCG